MNISEFCIRRPVFTTLLMAAVMVGGIAGYRSLATSALPNVDFPTIVVNASLPGASPETMASSVATPLERQFSTIAGIDTMTSTSFLGSSQITLQFSLSRSIDGAALDVQTAISTAMPLLPKEMTTPPTFKKVNPADQPVLYISLSSDTLPMSAVDEYADTLMAQRISTLSGVAEVDIHGEQKYAVRVQLDPNKLAAQGLSFDDIRQAVIAAASNAPVGVISGAKQLFNLDVAGQPHSANGFRELVAVWKNGAPVRLKELGTVVDDVQDNRANARMNGKRGIVLAIRRQPDANTIDVVNSVKALIPVFRSQLPASVEMTPMFDRSVSIRNSVHDVQTTLLITVTLVIGVIFLFLRHVRATFIPAIVVPLSIITTYGGMATQGFSINNVSLLALTLCVGFVVDDAIVMLENIMRYIDQGMKPFEASLKGSREIGFTIISITCSLVAVFIPVLFMGGVVGRVFHEFAVTISMAILISGIVSLTLTPMLCSRLLKPHSEEHESAFGQKLEAGFNWMLNHYERSLVWCLHHRFIMLMVTIATLFLSVVTFMWAPKGLFPPEDTGFIFAQTEASQDISFEAMVAKQTQVADVIRADPAVANVFQTVGGSSSRALNAGVLFFGLKPHGERPPVMQVIQRLRKEVAKVQGIAAYMQPVQNMQIGGRLSKSMYQYTLQSSDLNELYAISEKLKGELEKEPGFQDVTSDLQIKSLKAVLNVDQPKAASVGLTYDSIRKGLYNAFGENWVTTLYTAANDYEVILEVPPEAQQSPEDIRKLYLRGSNGLVPLEAVATVQRTLGPLTVNHQGQLPAVTISFNLAPGYALSEAVERINAVQKRLGMPESITGTFQGSAQVFQDSAKGQGGLLMLSVVVIYIILGMLYESFIHPVTILSGLPSAGIGAILTLLLFGMDVSVIAIVGIILLIGIVKKNAIMMVDFAISARAEGMPAEEAIYQSCMLRFRPIMMTTMSAIFGTLPIALGLGAGSELRQPLGVAVVGGLLTSQLLTLYITPVVYLYLERLSERLRARTHHS